MEAIIVIGQNYGSTIHLPRDFVNSEGKQSKVLDGLSFSIYNMKNDDVFVAYHEHHTAFKPVPAQDIRKIRIPKMYPNG
jgi:hypothetical protein